MTRVQLLGVAVAVIILGRGAPAEPPRPGAISEGLGARILIPDGPDGPIRGGESAVTDMVLADDGWVYGSTKATWGAQNCHLFRTDGKTREHVLNVTRKLPGQTQITDLEKGPDGLIYGCTSVDDRLLDDKKLYDGGHVFTFDVAAKQFTDLGVMIEGDGVNCIALDEPRNRACPFLC